MNLRQAESGSVGPWMRIRLPRGEWFYDPTHPLAPAGGFGEVFEGKGPSDQSVAVKRLKIKAADAAHRELKIADELAGKTFEHVLAVLDSGEDSEGGGYYLVMPRAERCLSDHVHACGILPPAEAMDILRQLAEGLKEVGNIVHRDLKPANVLLHEDQWKIADFGIARFVEDATSANTVRGFLSAPYAAPEQWRGEHATHATDVYALSCVAHVLLTGSPPFVGPSRADFQRQHISDTPPSLTSVDARARAIFAAGLRKPQAGRPPIERVIAVLKEIAGNADPPRPAIAALHAANAAEAERTAAAAAAAERERRKAAERHALISAGESILRDLMRRLAVLARENATEAQVHHREQGELIIKMGQADLYMELQGGIPPGVSFPSAGWEVLAIGRIKVKQGKPDWSHGATLWYMRLSPNAGYRWYEVAFKRHALTAGPPIGPFPIQDLGDDIYKHADLAAGPGMHPIEKEFGPVPIDDEDSEFFFERWLERLAQGYNGRLCPF